MDYDRTVSPALIEALLPGGPFSFLVRYAKTQYLADLELRGYPYPHSQHKWATLYVGLTGILHVYERDGKFWLKGNSKSGEWNKSWAEKRKLGDWRLAEEQLDKYLEREKLRGRNPRFTYEGEIQAILCKASVGRFGIIDREVIFGFPEGERGRTNKEHLEPLHDACRRAFPDKGWSVPKKFGGKLDLLAIDPDGRLLAIEVKSAFNLVGITWAPLQATFYAELLKAWSKKVGQESQDILHKMLQQRIDLGLTRDPNRLLKYPLEIVPVVAFGGPPTSPHAIPRLNKVKKALIDANPRYKSIMVWQVEGSVIQEIH